MSISKSRFLVIELSPDSTEYTRPDILNVFSPKSKSKAGFKYRGLHPGERMVQGRTPTTERDQETVELIVELKKKLGCKTDTELANKLGVTSQQLTNSKRTGFTKLEKGLARSFLH